MLTYFYGGRWNFRSGLDKIADLANVSNPSLDLSSVIDFRAAQPCTNYSSSAIDSLSLLFRARSIRIGTSTPIFPTGLPFRIIPLLDATLRQSPRLAGLEIAFAGPEPSFSVRRTFRARKHLLKICTGWVCARATFFSDESTSPSCSLLIGGTLSQFHFLSLVLALARVQHPPSPAHCPSIQAQPTWSRMMEI